MNKTIRPSLLYALLSRIKILVLIIPSRIFFAFFLPEMPDSVNLSALLIVLYYIYKVLLIRSNSYTITDQQIIFRRGLFSVYTDYVEIYRIKDFKEQRPFLLRLIGTMNVVLISSDRSVPNLTLKGIPSQAFVRSLREDVEYNRGIKRVYEID